MYSAQWNENTISLSVLQNANCILHDLNSFVIRTFFAVCFMRSLVNKKDNSYWALACSLALHTNENTSEKILHKHCLNLFLRYLLFHPFFCCFFFFALTHTENTKYTWSQTTDWSLQRGRCDSIWIMHVFIYVQKLICTVITKGEVSLGLLYCLQWGEVSSVLSVEVARLLVQGYTSVCMLYLLQAPAAWGGWVSESLFI